MSTNPKRERGMVRAGRRWRCVPRWRFGLVWFSCSVCGASGAKERAIHTIAVLISLLLAAPGGAARADRTDDEAIQEAVVRDHLKPPVQREEIYFLSIDRDNDPSEALLARLADLKVDVRKRSRAIVRTDVPGAKSQTVFDRRTNEPEILLELGHIRRRDRPIANVELRRYRGKLNASYYEYTLRKRDGRWTVNRRDKVGQS